MSENPQSVVLFDRDDVPDEAQPYMDELAASLENRHFPCFFARNAFRDNELLYGFADISTSLNPVTELFNAAVEAIERNIEQTIILWFTGANADSLEDEHVLTSKILLHLLDHDTAVWPEDAPYDPAHPRWDFWYRGIDFFINVSTPHHQKRHSRNLGSTYTLVIQSRTSFDIVEERSGTARPMIRKRIERYDDLPVSPALGVHGASAEIDQFLLTDSNSPDMPPLILKEQIEAAQQHQKEGNQ